MKSSTAKPSLVSRLASGLAIAPLMSAAYVSGDQRRSGRWAHDLVVVLRDGEQMTLISADRPERLLYLEQQLEQALELIDRPMRGAYPRT